MEIIPHNVVGFIATIIQRIVEQQTELSTIFPKKTFESIIKPEIGAALDLSGNIVRRSRM